MVNLKYVLIKLLENGYDCSDQILEIIGDNAKIFHQVLHYTVHNDRFDLYQKLLSLDFQIKFTILANILSADPQYFDCYLDLKGYCQGDIYKSLDYKLSNLIGPAPLGGPWAFEMFDRIKNIIRNMKRVDLESRNICSLIEIDYYLVVKGNSIEDEITTFLDQHQFEFDSDFALILSHSRLNLTKIILDTYYSFNYNLFL